MAKSGHVALVIQLLEDRVRLLTPRAASAPEASGAVDIPALIREEAGAKEFANRIFKEIESFSAIHVLRGGRALLAVSRGLLLWRYFSVPPVPAENLENLVGFELEKHLPGRPEDLYFQHLALERREDGWAVLLAGTRRDFIHPLEEALEMAGLKVAAIVPDLCGLVWLLKSRGLDPESGSAAVVSLEARVVEAAVLREGRPVFYRRYAFPEDIAAAAAGETPPSAEALGRVADETVRMIEGALREAGAAWPGHDLPDRGFLLDDGPAGDIVIQKLAGSAVGEWRAVKMSEIAAAKGRPAPVRSPGSLAAAGLAFNADGASRCPLDLAPRASMAPRRANPRVTAVLAGLCLAAAGLFFGRVAYLRQQHLNEVEAQTAQLRGRVATVKNLSDDLRRQTALFKSMETSLSSRTRVIDLLKELTGIIPPDAYLNQMSLKKNTVELTGMADSASGLISRLEASPFFKNVSFDAPIISQGQQKERFKIKMTLE